MQQKHKIHLALPRHETIRDATEKALHTASNLGLGNYELTGEIDGADVIVTDSATVAAKLSQLPKSVRYLQLIDCGPGPTQVSAEYVTFANASSILVEAAANWALEQWHEISGHSTPRTNNVAGIVGFGFLGYELGRRLRKLDAQVWVNDIRTPRQQSFQPLGARRSSLDMLLSTSDVVFIAIHPGPTSSPLLTHRELRLLDTNAAIINLSGPQVVDKTAIQTLNSTNDRQIDYREMFSDRGDASATELPELLTRYILDNLRKYALGHQPRCIIEPVTHPLAGDPAFWSSRMHPRQTPV